MTSTTTTGLDPTQPAGTPTPKAGAGKAFALWIATVLLKLLQVPDPPDTLKQAIATFLIRFGWLLVFGALVPPLCAFFLGLMDKMGATRLADGYRDYVVSGFSINESIYRADKERIDYLLQMRRVNFFEDDDVGGDSSVFISVTPGQQGRIVIERATLVQREQRADSGGGGTGPASEPASTGKCPKQPNPNLQSVGLMISDAHQDALGSKFTVNRGVPFEIDAKFWKAMKIDPSVADTIKSLRVAVLPPHPNQTRACFDLLVDFRIEVFKTRSR